MKKYLLLLVFALAALALYAQNNDMYSIMHKEWAGHIYSYDGVMQQRDGNFLIDGFVVEDLGNDINPLGNIFYKISPTSLTISDSLFIADTALTSCRSFQNPNGEGNIRSRFEYHADCDSCFLRISHFPDNDLHTNPDEDIVVSVCENYATGGVSIVDCKGDLILQYYKQIDALHHDAYVARFGIDGTLKHQALVFENEIFGADRLQMLKESPLKYFQWGFAETYSGSWQNLIIYALDSLFNSNPIIINSLINGSNEYLYVDGDTKVIPADGDNVLVAAKYVYEVNHSHPWEYEYGVVVVKYDIRTLQQKGHIVFNDYQGNSNIGKCLGINMMTDGTIYFLYKEDGYPEESFVAVKMDTDLNVEWKRFCKTDNLNIGWLQEFPIPYKNEYGEEKGIVWVGDDMRVGSNNYGKVFLYLKHDGTVGMNEGGMEVRPYAFYPNPVKEQLLMQFSPDVQPKQVELYDLQGRLVRTQSKAFESIDMSQLPAGTYTLRVTLEDGKTYSDKVVKE